MGGRRNGSDLQSKWVYTANSLSKNIQCYSKVSHPRCAGHISYCSAGRLSPSSFHACASMESPSTNLIRVGALVPLLKIVSFVCYLVGGGFFTGQYKSIADEVEPGSRFDNNRMQGQVGGLFSLTSTQTDILFSAIEIGKGSGLFDEVSIKEMQILEGTILRSTTTHSCYCRGAQIDHGRDCSSLGLPS